MGGGGDPNIGVLWGLNKAHTGNGGVKCWGRSQRDPKIRLLWGQNEAQKVNGVGGGRGTPMLGLWGALNWSYRGNGREYGGGAQRDPDIGVRGGPVPHTELMGGLTGGKGTPTRGLRGGSKQKRPQTQSPQKGGRTPKPGKPTWGAPKEGAQREGPQNRPQSPHGASRPRAAIFSLSALPPLRRVPEGER